MIRFNSKIGAAVALALGLLYAVAALATGHSARSAMPMDLSAKGQGVDVWQALNLLAQDPGQVALVDVRPQEKYMQFHLPGAVSDPGASGEALRAHLSGKSSVLIVAEKDAQGARLAGAVQKGLAGGGGSAAPKAASQGNAPVAHFLKGGAQAYFLALELPVPLFNPKPPPFGYEEAKNLVRQWMNSKAEPKNAQVVQAIEKLAQANYQPTDLSSKKKPQTSGKKKKIAGGCG